MLGLRYDCDVRVLVWVAIYWASTLYFYINFYSLSWMSTLALFSLSTAFSFFGATIVHNTIHVPMFRSMQANSVFQIVMTCTYGWPMSALVPGHNLSHHKFTNGPKDAMRPSKMRYESNLLNYLLFPVASVKAVTKFDLDYMADQKKLGRPIYKQYQKEAMIFYPMQIILALIDWKSYLVCWFLPQLYAKFQLIAMNTMQHDGCPRPEEDKWNHSRNFTGKLLNYFTFNNGYHTVHHNHPGLHWSKLEAEHNRLAHNIHPNLNEPNILGFWFRAFVYPADRLWFDGSKYILPPDVPNEPWYEGQTETYSSAPNKDE